MKSIYLYPKTDYKRQESANPYIHLLEKALEKNFTVINKTYLKHGVLDFLKHKNADIFFLNWIEDLPLKNFGIFQSITFGLFMLFSKIKHKKFIWVLHNIYTHSAKKRLWIRMGFNLMIKYSDLIITHSESGLDFIKKQYPDHYSKVRYFIHPVNKIVLSENNSQKIYDILIWGTIYPYKGLVDFLKFVNTSAEMKDLKILITGRCPDSGYKICLKQNLPLNAIYRDEFCEIEEIAKLAGQSEFILFTYNSPSVLSSGSLMDSIQMRRPVIGPDKGAFADLKNHRFIKTFKNYNEIIEIIKIRDFEDQKTLKDLDLFCFENSWDKYSELIHDAIVKI